jgi:hypothetical protein
MRREMAIQIGQDVERYEPSERGIGAIAIQATVIENGGR